MKRAIVVVLNTVLLLPGFLLIVWLWIDSSRHQTVLLSGNHTVMYSDWTGLNLPPDMRKPGAPADGSGLSLQRRVYMEGERGRTPVVLPGTRTFPFWGVLLAHVVVSALFIYWQSSRRRLAGSR